MTTTSFLGTLESRATSAIAIFWRRCGLLAAAIVAAAGRVRKRARESFCDGARRLSQAVCAADQIGGGESMHMRRSGSSAEALRNMCGRSDL